MSNTTTAAVLDWQIQCDIDGEWRNMATPYPLLTEFDARKFFAAHFTGRPHYRLARIKITVETTVIAANKAEDMEGAAQTA